MYQPDRDKKAIMPPPVVNDVVSPKLRRDAAIFAPITNHFSPDAAAGKLAASRLTRSGQPMPNTIGPPAPGGLAQPPQQGFFQRYAPSSSANMAYGSTPRPGESNLGALGRSVTGAAGMATAIPEAFATSLLQGGANSAKAWGGAIKDAYGGMTGAPVTHPAPTAQAPVPNTATPPAANQRPIVSIGPKQIASGVNALAGALTRPPGVAGAPAAPPAGAQPSTVIEYTGDGKSGKANAAAPGQVALSERTQQPLPGKPLVGADGSVQYDQAFVTRNPQLMGQYAAQNVVQTVVPGAGVAQSMATGGNMQAGALSRPPRGFTTEDRARQLEGLTNLGNGYQMSEARDFAKRARMYAMGGDNTQAAAMQQQAAGEAALMTAPPATSSQAMATQGMAQQKQAADIGQQNAKLAMEQDKARIDAEQSGIQTQAQQLQLQQAQQMNDLSQKMIAGDKEAAAQLAMLTKQDPGKPITFVQETPVQDKMGAITMQKTTGYFDPRTGKVTMLGAAQQEGAIPIDEAIKTLQGADSPENRKWFKETYGQDPAQFLGQ